MKTNILLAFVLASAAAVATAAEHRSPSTPGAGHSSPGRYDNTRITRVPQLVQKRVISREAITQWVPDPGHEFVDERNPRRLPKGRWVPTGKYRVTYIEVYDDRTSRTYSVEE